MNKIRLPKLLYVGLLLVLTACQATEQSLSAAMFQPGDMIAGMSVTTGAKDAPPLWAFCSPAQSVGNTITSDCTVPMVPKLAIGHVFRVADGKLTKLDWSEITWQLFIDDQTVDLESFGTYDFVLPTMSQSPSPIREVFKKFTAWDVVLTNLRPGEHTIKGVAQMSGDNYTWVINLTIEANALGTGTQWTGIQKIS